MKKLESASVIAEYLDTTADFQIYSDTSDFFTPLTQQRLLICNKKEKAIFFANINAVFNAI